MQENDPNTPIPVQTEKSEIRRDNSPILETKIRKSNDGQWVIHQTIITDIKPIKYWQKVMENSSTQ